MINFLGLQNIRCYCLLLILFSLLAICGQAYGEPSAIYSINVGGSAVSANGLTWSSDSAVSPSPYVNTGNQFSTANAVDVSDASIPAGTPSNIFQSERWDSGASPEMQWDLPVISGNSYEVRLYFAEIYSGAFSVGKRVFDVAIDGTVVLDDYDVYADVGGSKGVMKSFIINAIDGNLDIDFIHVAENPAVKAIQIIDLDAGSTSDLGASLTSINFGDVTIGGTAQLNVQFSNLGTTGNPDIVLSNTQITGFDAVEFSDNFVPLTLGPGESTIVTVSFNPLDPAGSKSATLEVTHNGNNTPVNISLTGTAVAEVSTGTTVLYRVNAGGSLLTDTPDWETDTNTNPSLNGNAAATGNKTFISASTIDLSDSSLAVSAPPQALFQAERYDPAGAAEMQWNFPVASGTYEVRLYFAEIFTGAFSVGTRVFDVAIEGSLVLDDYDVYADVGGFKGVMKSFIINATDGSLDIDLLHVTENPAIKGIEILQSESVSNPGILGTTPTSLTFGNVTVDGTAHQSLQFTHLGTTGDLDIVLSNAQITGTDAVEFSHNFVPTILSPGQSKTITIKFNPLDPVGSKSATLEITHNGTNTPVNIPLTGNAVAVATPGDLGVSLTSINYGDVTVGNITQQSVQFSHLGVTGDPDIVLNDTQITGFDAVEFSDDFVPLILSPGESTTVTVSFNPLDPVGSKSAALEMTHNGNNSPVNVSLTGNAVEAIATGNTVLYRVNAGGSLLVDTPDWVTDTSANPSSNVNAAGTGNKTFITGSPIDLTDSTLAVSAPPQALFQAERYDPAGAAEMQWDFPVASGTYEVRLYFAEIFTGAFSIGKRVFDVAIEGNLVLDDYDIYADVGGYKGVMKSFIVDATDGSLNIDLLHVKENPAIKGIEIIQSGSNPGVLSATPSSINFGDVAVGGTAQMDVQFTHSGATGDPDIVLNSAQITGFDAVDFGDDFVPLTLSPGESTTVTVSFNPLNPTGSKTAVLEMTHDGTNTPVSVTLTGNAVTANPGDLGASLTNINYGDVTIGSNASQEIQLTNQGTTGDPDIALSVVIITGFDAVEFSHDFVPMTLSPGESTTVTVSFNPLDPEGAKSAAFELTHNGNFSTLSVPLTGNAVADVNTGSTVLYRVNVGGSVLVDTPDWSADSNLNPSPNGNAAGTGNKTFSTENAINLSDSSLAGLTTPQALFQAERYDPAGGAEMQWDFLVSPGLYEVRLYFAEIFTGAFSVGSRIIDVAIEGSILLDDYDVYADVGGYKGVMKPFIVNITDGNLDIDFIHVVENPSLKGIEIIKIGNSSNQLFLSPSQLNFGSVVLGSSSLQVIQLTNGGIAGDPDIVVNSTQISGSNSSDYSDNFTGSVTLGPGETTAVQVTFNPTSSSGNKSATLAINHSGSNSPLQAQLSGLASDVPSNVPISFGKSLLKGTSGLNNPTSLQFGPDDRLYVSEQGGLIRAYTISRDGSDNYSVTDTEIITTISTILNHDDDGTPNPGVNGRLVTGILITGTASNPVIYVNSSDPRIGAGSSGIDKNLDTNSGILSRLTWNGAQWVKLDLVVGLPRSEENHAPNGIQLDSINNLLYTTTGGNTNHGAASHNFGLTPEYALSTAMLEIDLAVIGETTYNLPTLDDEDRPTSNDSNDPFGGNDGKNQAILEPNGPVQVYASGLRNAYDNVMTANGFFTIDNGGNAGWGNVPVQEGPAGNCTNAVNEPGKTDQDGLHFISGPGYYAGHPNPTRGNMGNTFNSSNPQSPVSFSNPVECDYREAGNGDGALTVFPNSTNGITQYLATNFANAMTGDLLAVSFNNKLYRLDLDASGTGLVSKETLISNVGSGPLDVTAVDDFGLYPGTIWVANIANDTIGVLEPADFSGTAGPTCTGADDAALDEDSDNYNNADEIDNGTNPCSAADFPADSDGDFISNLNDPDDDNDGLNDTVDPFAIDSANGAATNLPVNYQWENDSPAAGGLLGLGFTGLMTNFTDNYEALFDITKMTAGGAAGVATIDEVSNGDALGASNSQEFAFQFGVNVDQGSAIFTAHTRILSPFAGITPQDSQSMGLFVGNGDQDNYFKIVVSSNGGLGGINAGVEIGGVYTNLSTSNENMPGPGSVDLYLTVNPAAATIQARYTVTNSGTTGPITDLGVPQSIPPAWLNSATKLAVGIISTSAGSAPVFPATWDFVEVTPDVASVSGWGTAAVLPIKLGEVAGGIIGNKMFMIGEGNDATLAYDFTAGTWTSPGTLSPRIFTGHHHAAEVFNGKLYLIGGLHDGSDGKVQIYDPVADSWTTGATAPFLAGSSATAIIGGKIYFAGGIIGSATTNKVAVYDLAQNSWSATLLAPMPQGVNHAAAATDGSKLYVFGGRDGGNSVSNGFNYLQIYDPVTNTWESSEDAGSTLLPLPQARGGMGKAVLHAGELYVIGGETTNGPGATADRVYNRVDIYNPVTKTWRLGSAMPTARHGIFPLLRSGKIYVAGGGVKAGNSQSTVFETYNPD